MSLFHYVMDSVFKFSHSNPSILHCFSEYSLVKFRKQFSIEIGFELNENSNNIKIIFLIIFCYDYIALNFSVRFQRRKDLFQDIFWLKKRFSKNRIKSENGYKFQNFDHLLMTQIFINETFSEKFIELLI